ncbi:unnamed protein product [Timema podura]|uniref:Tubulin epsilon and delta complex protein 1 domain-containing protein n=1 Tax=Timema podura TaxID=61482 RepID=A0ABN7P4X7_TIMPD|nr:unnamed protein product [Timema podura]
MLSQPSLYFIHDVTHWSSRGSTLVLQAGQGAAVRVVVKGLVPPGNQTLVVTMNKTLGELAEPSVLQAKLKLHPELVAIYDKKVDDTKELINTHQQWNKHCNVFWKWMETVLAEKRKQLSQSSSSKETENLVILMNVLKCTVKSLLESRSEIKTSSHQEIALEGLERCHFNIISKETELKLWLHELQATLNKTKENLRDKPTVLKYKIEDLLQCMKNL